MRVIAGRAKGTALRSPEDMGVRPTTDRIKEAVFGSIQFEIAGARVLDMFCGSGALGIEALSRGAQCCVFADCAKSSIALAKDNLSRTGLEREAELICADFTLAAKRLCGRTFDFIFLDPPYKAGLYEACLAAIDKNGLCAPGARIICESDGGFSEEPFTVIKRRKYGKTYITVLKDERI